MRGIAIGLLVSVPIWVVLGLAAYAIARAVGVVQ